MSNSLVAMWTGKWVSGGGIVLRESVIQKGVHPAAHHAGLTKRVTTHVFRRSLATHLLEGGYAKRTVQEPVLDVRKHSGQHGA
jgi:site-specific recombinase XerD